MTVGSKINLTFLHVDLYYEEWWCGGDNCTCDYVEILGQRYCGSSLPDPIISCNLEVKFSSFRWRFEDNQGFRAEWTEIPDDGECGLHTLSHLSVLCLVQGSHLGPSVQGTIAQKSATVAQSVSPGHLEEAPGMGPAPSTASTPSLWHTWSPVTTLDIVTQASCVKMDSVLELINTISTNGTKQLLNNMQSKIIKSQKP